LPAQAAATISSKKDAAGRSFCLDLRTKLAHFLFMSAEFFNLTPEFPQVCAHFALLKHKMSTNRAILISNRTRPTAVGNRRILRKV
jgi:hypothetical protein